MSSWSMQVSPTATKLKLPEFRGSRSSLGSLSSRECLHTGSGTPCNGSHRRHSGTTVDGSTNGRPDQSGRSHRDRGRERDKDRGCGADLATALRQTSPSPSSAGYRRSPGVGAGASSEVPVDAVQGRPVSSSGSSGGHIRVAVRVRPLPAGDEGIIEVAGSSVIAIRKEAATGGNQFLSTQQGRIEERCFDQVFGPNATQTEVYAWSCEPLISEAVSKGRSATVFVYGATGAGKTHTMFGDSGSEQRGLIFRAIPEVFRCLEEVGAKAPHGSFEVKVSFLEIYNEVVRDLLQPQSQQESNPCRVLEDASRGVVKVANLLEAPTRTADEALWFLQAGMQARTVEATAANSQSSRAHAVFTLTIEQVKESKGTGPFARRSSQVRTVYSKISLIDLAGSERAGVTQNTGSALKDGARINQSLLALANCIDALTQRGPGCTAGVSSTPRKKPPYRDSKLTLMLKGSLTGDGLVAMIANVHPGRSHFEDSNNTLEYAKRAAVVRAPQGGHGRRQRISSASLQPSPVAPTSPWRQDETSSSSSLPHPSGGGADGGGNKGPFSCWEVSASSSLRQQPADSSEPTTASNSSPEECLSEISLSLGQPDVEGTETPTADGVLFGTGRQIPIRSAPHSGGSTPPEGSDPGGPISPDAFNVEAGCQPPSPDSDEGAACWTASNVCRVVPGEAPSPARQRRPSVGPHEQHGDGNDEGVLVTSASSPALGGADSLAARIVATLHAEKAQLSSRLSGVLRERDAVVRERDALLKDRRELEEENERLRAASVEKDRQLAQLLARCAGSHDL